MTWRWVILLSVLATAAAADDVSEAERLDATRYYLAAAREPGDPVSDLHLSQMLSMSALPFTREASDAEIEMMAEAAEEFDRLMARVEQAIDGNPMLLALRINAWRLQENPEAQRRAWRDQLAQVGRDNAYNALVVMTSAWSQGDAAGFLAAAEWGASAPRYDSYHAAAYRSVEARFRRVPDDVAPGIAVEPASDEIHRASVIAILGAVALPAFENFVQPCLVAEDALRSHCLAIAERMLEHGTNPIEVSIAIAVVSKLGDASQVARAARRHEEMAWYRDQVPPLLARMEAGSLTGAGAYFHNVGVAGELEAQRQLLRDNGISVTPPVRSEPRVGNADTR